MYVNADCGVEHTNPMNQRALVEGCGAQTATVSLQQLSPEFLDLVVAQTETVADGGNAPPIGAFHHHPPAKLSSSCSENSTNP
jgi:hypothetical protein